MSSGRQSPNSGQRSSGGTNAFEVSKPGWGEIRASRLGLRRPTCLTRPSTRRPGTSAGDQAANPVTSLTSRPFRHADIRGDLPGARTQLVRLPGCGVHGRPSRAPAPPTFACSQTALRLSPACQDQSPGARHQLTNVNGYSPMVEHLTEPTSTSGE